MILQSLPPYVYDHTLHQVLEVPDNSAFTTCNLFKAHWFRKNKKKEFQLLSRFQSWDQRKKILIQERFTYRVEFKVLTWNDMTWKCMQLKFIILVLNLRFYALNSYKWNFSPGDELSFKPFSSAFNISITTQQFLTNYSPGTGTVLFLIWKFRFFIFFWNPIIGFSSFCG